ncbi:alkaline phosphatase [Ramlibacter sp. G-1-2-2]|uniref:Alkaline phosphatase n=1 Tax=Ramlibacter agri TaxID=2728837 RepID=A0A848H690_9BURK|nr:alkaline phosphatase D family protein [Ramlibacter agri]NML44810.1 alkaline phosphatase [Ramlibacter agri]
MPSLRRRRLLGGAVAAASLACPSLSLRAQAWRGPYPFTLGVASGCPTPEGVVLWTRLAPEPLQGGGMGETAVDVHWELARDEAFTRIAARGKVQATAADAHSVRVELRGLEPGRHYWYRFTAGGARSATGRTRTAPALDSDAPVRFAFASCQQYEQGYFSAYRDMAAQPLDLVVHLGDYIYENSWGSRLVRHHEAGIPTELAEFRDRYALYKSDRDLQAAHAACPWLVSWDDHEVANDYTGDVSPRMADPARFLAVRAAAYQAWYEHMPVPASARPQGPDARIYARYRFGRMVDLVMLDGRQYRSHHACVPATTAAPLVDCPDRLDPSRTFLGAQQEAWLASELALPATQWTVIAQPTLLASAERARPPGHGYWMDGWDGYAAARDRLLETLATRRPRNAIVASGDVHAFWAADLRRQPDAPVLAAEFVGGAITSEGPSAASVANMLARNPHLKYGRGDRRGYAIADVDGKRCAVEFRAADDEKEAASAVRTLKRFVVADGAAGVQLAGG